MSKHRLRDACTRQRDEAADVATLRTDQANPHAGLINDIEVGACDSTEPKCQVLARRAKHVVA